jgi:glycosyltransferase involved in cell wall biosynthesis
MDDLALQLGVRPVMVSSLQREPGLHDLRALISVIAILRRRRPQIVHTHAAKGGTIGRVASLFAFPRRSSRPILVHTFHGHSLSGYFSARTAAVYRVIERVLARRTDRLIAVSDEVRDDLVSLGIAAADRFEVIPLGFELSGFAVEDDARMSSRTALRAELGIEPDALVITLVARLVPIKRVDRFLAAAAATRELDHVHFLIVGDGELHDALRGSPEALALGDRVTWAGFRRDMPAIYFASDVVALTSDNEGTPVSLIEAAAAGLPAVSTRVGGAGMVVRHEKTGLLVDGNDPQLLARAFRTLMSDQSLRARMGAAAREHALESFGIERLISDVDGLYRRLLAGADRLGAKT